MPGVIAIVTGAELAKVCTPWVGVLSHLKGLKSAPQHAIAIDRACWQGEAVAAIVATSRAAGEDAAERVLVDWEELEPVTDMATALDAATPVIHPELGDNLAFERNLDAGAVDAAFAEADHVVEAEFVFGRHTGVTLEPRSIIADWNPGEERLTVYQGTQAPHMMQNIFAKHLGLEEAQVRVVCKDVGGSFGIKVHVYADDMATVALSKLLRRPVKFVADRLESFNTDIHARDHRCKGRAAVKADGTITAFEIDDLTGIGPYSVYPRTSAIEANQVVNLVGGPYTGRRITGRGRASSSRTRTSCASTARSGIRSPARSRRGWSISPRAPSAWTRPRSGGATWSADDAYPCASPSGLRFEALSHHAALDKLLAMMDYDALRAEQAASAPSGHLSRHRPRQLHRSDQPQPGLLRRRRRADFLAGRRCRTHGRNRRGHLRHQHHRAGPGLRGHHRADRRAARSACRWTASASSSATPTTRPMAAAPGRRAARGSAARRRLQAGKQLRRNILDGGRQPSCKAEAGCARHRRRHDRRRRRPASERMPLAELARIVYFRPDTLPPGFQAEMMATRHFVPREYPFAFTNGVQASWLEVDTETGFITLLNHWVVEDCGTIINPQLVDEQIRGGVVQGLGAALFEHCLYDERGQLTNATMADYLVPMAAEMPDIEVGHVVTPTKDGELGAKGAGEAGTAGAAACVANAVNDALSPFGVTVTEIPLTPQLILTALGRI